LPPYSAAGHLARLANPDGVSTELVPGGNIMIGTSPVRRRMLGAALRRYRESLGYTLEEAACVLACDRSKISRIETGHRGIRPGELRDLLAEYGVDDPAQRGALTALADPRAARGWWQAYAEVLPEASAEYLVIEAMAAQVLVYDSQRVPGLLQTGRYAHAVASADPAVPAALRDRAAETVLIRQQAFQARKDGCLEVVIGEGALRQEAGDSEVMRSQLAHLAAEVTIQVLPFTSGAHAAASPVAILWLARPDDLGVAHLGGWAGGVFIDSQADVAGYSRTFTHLQASALTPQASTRLLRDMASA
jgi:transcriptional regulator with XRE-family HTH domain